VSARPVCKPSSVPVDAGRRPVMVIHLGPSVARRLMRPTRGLGSAPLPCAGHPAPVAPSYLALLQVEFARFTPPPDTRSGDGIVTVALVLVSRRTGVTRHPALWSSDFPHGEPGCPGRRATIRPPRWRPRFYPRHRAPAVDGPEPAVGSTSISRTIPLPPLTSCSSTSPTPGAYFLCSMTAGSSFVKSSVITTLG
jgi:hypothetical protein